MLVGRLRYCRFHFRGRGGAWLALLGQLIAVVGLPLPPASAKDVSSPFPCQQRACGCMTASDCWKSCCCFTAAQRVQWAREHDAEVPAELVEDVEEECASCVTPEEEDSESCCTKQTIPPGKPKAAAAKHGGWLLVIQARRCGGGPAEEANSAPTVSPVAPLVWRFEWTRIDSLPLISVSAENISYVPTVPPPRA
jgi:hypothetical protein